MSSVSISEYASWKGISSATVRRRIKAGKLPAQKVITGQGYVWMLTIEDNGNRGVAGGVQDQLVDFLKDQLAEKDKQIQQLHVLLQQKALGPGQGRPWWRFWGG